MNAIGALVTAIVLIVVGVTKAHEGAWIIMVLIPLHVLVFKKTQAALRLGVARQLTLRDWSAGAAERRNTVLVPISGVQRAVVEARELREELSTTSAALYVDVDPARRSSSEATGSTWGQGVPLVVLRVAVSLADGAAARVHRAGRSTSSPTTTSPWCCPEFVPARWWHHLFHNQRALLIKGALLFRRNTVVTSVPFHLSH